MSPEPAKQEATDPRCDDIALARAVASGDAISLRSFFDAYADLLFAFLRHRMEGTRADVEDAWQETLAAAVRGIGSYRGESSLFCWMCGIARRKAADAARRAARKAVEADAMDMPPIAEVTFDDAFAERADVRARVIEVLGGLPADQRTALVDRCVHHRKVPDIARRLGRSYKATESLLSRAREAFRAAWEEREHGEE
jgi:RNA polymerase sigma-70 factor (ECF subfamily)